MSDKINIDEIYKVLDRIREKSGDEFSVTIHSDGSGTINNEVSKSRFILFNNYREMLDAFYDIIRCQEGEPSVLDKIRGELEKGSEND